MKMRYLWAGLLALLGTHCASTPARSPSDEAAASLAQDAEAGEHEHHESAAHTSGAPDSAAPAAAVSSGNADERAAYERARPVFERYCASCHSSAGTGARTSNLDHFNMDGYPLGGHHQDAITAVIREVLGASGEPPSMPRDRPGAVQGDELQLVLAWASAVDQAHTALEHSEHEKHEHQH